MNIDKFEKGDLAYTESGHEVEFIAEIGGEVVVRSILYREDDEPCFGKPFTTNRLYKSVPSEKYDAKIKELTEKIVSLSKEKIEIELEIRASLVDEKERKQRIMQNAALKRIDDFLAGKFTHFVYIHYKIEIVSFDAAVLYKRSDYDKVPDQMRLLCLYGDANGNLGWGLHDYRDGSGMKKTVIPCMSLEEAKDIAQYNVNLAYDAWRADPNKSHDMARAADSAEKIGLTIPADVAAFLKEIQIKNLTERRNKAKIDYENIEATLQAELSNPAL